jgi:succinate-semialdehyde dehydrogenase / glutarate-semialdehyde dehydrogenase
MRLSSDTVKRLSLELGGNAPLIVFDDADLDTAVSAAMASKFRNAGQTCVCADRFLVHSSIHDEFCQRLLDEIRKIQVGPGIDASTKMGPLISSQAAKTVHEKVSEAIDEGAKLVTGGRLLMEDLGSHFYEPTMLTHVSTKSRIFTEETFGPVVAVTSFDDEEEAVLIANDCSVGLASYFCTRDLSRALRVSHQIEAGLVGVNEGIISTCTAPFGGVKESGLGREGSPVGISEYLETKYIFLNT